MKVIGKAIIIWLVLWMPAGCSDDEEFVNNIIQPQNDSHLAEEIEPEENVPSNVLFPLLSWETDDPENHGFNSTALQDTAVWAEEVNSDSLVIIVDGYIIFEKYWNDNDHTSLLPVWSVSKSFTSALVGIAQYHGYLDIHEEASLYIEEWVGTDSESVTISDLLSNSSGRYYDFLGDFLPLAFPQRPLIPNLTQYAIDRGQQHDPGTVWVYNNMAIQCLERVLSLATGMDAAAFGKTHLLNPLHMLNTTIGLDMEDQMVMPAGIYSTARDMARLGYLFLNQGYWNGEQILSQAYVKAAISASTSLNHSYGLLFWRNTDQTWVHPAVENSKEQNSIAYPDAPLDVFAASGNNGQVILVSPSDNMVIVRQGHKIVVGPVFINDLYKAVKAAAN